MLHPPLQPSMGKCEAQLLTMALDLQAWLEVLNGALNVAGSVVAMSSIVGKDLVKLPYRFIIFIPQNRR